MTPTYSQERAEPPPAVAETDGRLADLRRRLHLGARSTENWVQFLKFGIVGGSGYLINLVAFALFYEAVGVHHELGAVLAFCVAITNNFVLNRLWTFRGTQGHAGFQAARFLAVGVGALGINLVVLALLVDRAGMSALPAQAIAVASAMPFNFLGNKLWTFR